MNLSLVKYNDKFKHLEKPGYAMAIKQNGQLADRKFRAMI